jgi:hypothetical protein
MAAQRKAPLAPTTEQLELALRQLWRPGYPRTLAEALDHPTFGTCVKGLAGNLARAQPPAARAHRLPMAPVPPTPTEEPARTRRRPVGSLASCEAQAQLGTWKRLKHPGWIDRKRAAANDFDD